MLVALPTSASAAAPVCTDATHTIDQGTSLALVGQCTGDGTLSYSMVIWPGHGSLSGSPDGTATYTPSITFHDTDSFRYRATDSTGQFDEATVTIHVTPAPIGVGLPPSCPTSTQTFIPLGGTTTLTGNCSDPEGGPIQYGIATFPTRGTFSNVTGNSVDYTHTAGDFMPDSFNYTASDGFTTLTRTVAITITDPLGSSYSTGSDATPAAPFQAEVDTSDPAAVVVGVRQTSEEPPDGFLFLGQEYNIVAPAQSIEDPLKLTFTIDRLQVPLDQQVEIFRDDAPIETMCDGSGQATPDDPCIVSRGFVDSSETSDYRIVVLTSHASRWNTGIKKAWPFGGFKAPVNAAPTLNTGKAGRSVPVKFSLAGDRGLGVFAPGSPSSKRVSCPNEGPVDPLEASTDSQSGLQYDPLTDTYTYVWKTSAAWAGQCRRLSVAFADPDAADHEAVFQFK
jgi:hypothetical protein